MACPVEQKFASFISYEDPASFQVSAQILLQSHVCVVHNLVPRPSRPVTYSMLKQRGKAWEISSLAMSGRQRVDT